MSELTTKGAQNARPLMLRQLLTGRRLLAVGGTGFLGKVWLSLLLHRYPELGHVYLVVRPRKGQDTQARFWAEVVTSPTFDPLREKYGRTGFEEFIKEKITPIPGDVSDPFAGVPESVRDQLRGRIDAMVNIAGVVDFNPPLDYALKSNAFGMQNLVALAKDLGGVPFMHTSTCYVAGDRTGEVHEIDPLSYPFPKADKLEKQHWDPAREIAECVDLVENVRHRANDAFRQSAFLDQAKKNLIERGEPARGSALADELEKVRRKFIEDRLIKDGTERAKFWGWHNIYTYTKSIGEQILCLSGLPFTIVRPAVIESSIEYPEVGWCEGVNTSAPLIYLSMKGPGGFPAEKESVLDVIPVDMVSAGMICALGELLEGNPRVVYQLGSSDSAPLPMYRLIELVGLGKRRHYNEKAGGNPLFNWIMAHNEPGHMTAEEYYASGPTAQAGWVKSVAGFVRSVGGPLKPLTGPAAKQLETVSKQLLIRARILDQFVPFTATHNYRFSCANTRAAYMRLPEAERAQLPWWPERIDWRYYLLDVHIPGLERHVMPEIDERITKPAEALRRHDTLTDLIDEVAERHRHAAALAQTHTDGFAVVTYQSLREHALTVAARLRSLGLNPGDRVLVSGQNHHDWPIVYFGALYAGGVVVPVDPALKPEQIANIQSVAQLRFAVMDQKARDAFGGAIACVQLDLHELAASGDADELEAALAAEPHRCQPNDVASILFTSGTTGTPKGVMLTHTNFCSLLGSLGKIFPLRETDRILSVLPLHHTFEFSCGLLLPLSRGARIIYLDEINGERLTYGLREGRVTGMVGVPALWQLLERRIRGQVKEKGAFFEVAVDLGLDLNRWLGKTAGLDVGRLFFGSVHDRLGGNIRFLISGGAALPRETHQLFQGLGLHLAEGYGLTEAAPVLAVAEGGPGTKAGSVGKAIPGVTLKILNPDKDGVGEVLARGPNVMMGYFGNAEATAQVLDGDGWLHTGDIGRIDHKGRLSLLGRSKEVVVNASGENIYLDDVESTLGTVSGVKEYSLVGLADPRGGERLGLLAVPEEVVGLDRSSTHVRVKEALRDAVAKLPASQRPSVIHLVDADLPRTSSRKVVRKEVKKVLEKIVAASSTKHRRGESVAEPVAQAIAQVAGVDPATVTADTLMTDELHFDSLMWVELASALESLEGGQPDAEALTRCETVADVVRLVNVPKPTIVREEDVRDRVQIPSLIAQPLKSALGWAQRELYGTGLRTEVIGQGNIPQNRPVIVVSNHCSHLDMGLVKYALGPYGQKLVALAAKDYFFEGNKWVVAYFEQLTNLEPIDRKRGFRASLEQAKSVISNGNVVLLFPEGTRRTDGVVGEFKPLVGWLALDTGFDILPLHREGTFDALPKGAVLPRKRDVKVRIGPALTIGELERLTRGLKHGDAARRVARMAQTAVEALRDGEVLELSRCAPEDFAEVEAPKEPAVVTALKGLPNRFAKDRLERPISWYFSLGEKDGPKWTVILTAEGCTVSEGRPPGGSADCVVKTSPEILTRIIRDGYVPDPGEFFSGAIKTNDIPLLIEFSRVFQLSEVSL